MNNQFNSVANTIIVTTALISVLATLIVIVKFLTTKLLWNFDFFMIFMLCLNDFTQALTISLPIIIYWITDSTPPQTCDAQGALELLAVSGQLYWTFAIAFSVFHCIKFESPKKQQKRKIILITLGFAIPVLFAIIPLFSQSYVINLQIGETLCFADGLYSLILFTIPLLIIMSLNYFFFCAVYFRLKSVFGQELNQTYKLFIYPTILLLCQGCDAIYFIVYLINPTSSLKIFQLIGYSTSNLMGLCDSIAYGCAPSQQNSVRQSLDAYSILNSSRKQSIHPKENELQ